jgi:hypothetical protein
MRPYAPWYRFRASVTVSLLFAAAGAFGAVEHRAKHDETSLFRTRLLEPPPLASLAEGEALEMLVPGRNESMVETLGGLRGWVRNADLVAVKLAEGGRHRLSDQRITSEGGAISPAVLNPPPAKVRVEELDRSFDDEVIEAIDREQLEMRNDEN